MNTEEKERLIKADMMIIENKVIHAFNQGYELGRKDIHDPQRVIYSSDGYYDGQLVYDIAQCPHCDYEYEEGDKDWNMPFCPNCGQSLIWEDGDANKST